MNLARIGAQPIGRRGFLALGGGTLAAGALAACGTEPEEPSTERDVELLGQALVGEENATSALQQAESEASADDREIVRTMREAASKQATGLQDAIEQLGETPSGDFGVADEADPLSAALAATNEAVGAYRLGAGQFSTEELRRKALELISADGARLALLNDLLGDPLAPYAFVTGKEEEPLSFPEDFDDDDDETTTRATTTGDAETAPATTTTTTEAE